MATTYTRDEILDIIERQAQSSDIPRDDFLRFFYMETDGQFNAEAHNHDSHAKGLFQFVPSTAAEFGLTGREFDAAANTEAAAALYARNRSQIVTRSVQTESAFLSGADEPNGMDMYLAHQQGGGGYASIQSAIATGEFSRPDTRNNILGNISARDFERVTGRPYSPIPDLNDRDLASSFAQYWSIKYATVEIADRDVVATMKIQTDKESLVTLADGVIQRGERGEEVRALQDTLNQTGFRDALGGRLETASGIYGQRTEEAVRSFQRVQGLESTGRVDALTREALLAKQTALELGRRDSLTTAERGEGNERVWPSPGNEQINATDKPREDRGEFGALRSGGHTHGGIDIQGEVGDPIVAFGPGRATVIPNNRAAGNTIRIAHDDGSLTKYFHLDKMSVRDGQRVVVGEQIGTMGRTGNTPAQGHTHLHFELWHDGRRVDPMLELRGSARGSDEKALHQAPLRIGAQGGDVVALQEQLERLGYRDAQGNALAPDGVFGVATRHAVEQLQRDQDIKVDGAAGLQTRGALQLLDGSRDTGNEKQAATRNEQQGGFVERMFTAIREGDDALVQKTIEDFSSSFKAQTWAHLAEENGQSQQGEKDGHKR